MIIKTFEEVRTHFSDTTDNNFDNFLPFLYRAKRKILKIIPEELYNLALQHYQSVQTETEHSEENETTSTHVSALITLIQSCLVYYGLYLRHPLQNAVLTENGWQQTWNDTVRPLRSEDAKEIRKEILFLFHESVEALIEFLNSGHFEIWNNSKEKMLTQHTLFRHAADFSKYVAIDDSARFFYLLLPEIHIASILLQNQIHERFSELQTAVHADSVNANDMLLLDECRYYCAYYAVSKVISKVAVDDVPACLFGIAYDKDTRDMFSLTYAQNADVKIKTVAAYIAKEQTIENTDTAKIVNNRNVKYFSM